MAKDPAFLFYTSDFLTGTMFMSNEQVGKYVRLLCAQHQHGHLTEEHMINICQTHDNMIWDKFEKLPDGKYHNKRLHNEVLKRNNFCESRRNNRLSSFKSKTKNKKHMSNTCKTYVRHMENENEDVNAIEIEYVNDLEKELINSFLEYRKEIHKPYKSNKSIKAMVENLRKLGNNDLETMKEIVQQTIAGQYQGLFPLKEKGGQYGTRKRNSYESNEELRKYDNL